MPTQGSDPAGPLVVELVGPLMDDGAAVGRTLAGVLTREGVELRPGSVEQVTGAAAPWAIATLMEGHGQPLDPERLRALEAKVVAGWRQLAGSGAIRVRPDALAAVRSATAARPVALLTGLPADVARTLLETSGCGAALIAAAGEVDGLPRSALLAKWLAEVAPHRVGVTALLASPPACLAAIAAGCTEVLLVGEASPAAMLLAERRVADVREGLVG